MKNSANANYSYPRLVERGFIPSINKVIEYLSGKVTNVIDKYNPESKNITKNYSQKN